MWLLATSQYHTTITAAKKWGFLPTNFRPKQLFKIRFRFLLRWRYGGQVRFGWRFVCRRLKIHPKIISYRFSIEKIFAPLRPKTP